MPTQIKINRAPVLTLWATVVAERLGYDHAEALTLARAVTGLNAQSKGERLGIYKEGEEKKAREREKPPKETVELLGRAVPVEQTKEGVRATSQGRPMNPKAVEGYLKSKFGDDLDAARSAMEKLAQAMPPSQLSSRAYTLYEEFRPQIPAGKKGWGAKGELDLDYIKDMAERFERRKNESTPDHQHRHSRTSA